MTTSLDMSRLSTFGQHWFWTSFWRYRRVYGLVVVAAALINVFSLATSLFIMTVYDRVIPNDATESLIALVIGMVIVLTFDFILKSLRASFLEEAGAALDSKIGGELFAKLMNLRLAKVGPGPGRLASVIREFESLRNFLTSASLIAIVDLPFILMFIGVIALVGGWIAIVPLLALPVVLVSGALAQPLLSRFQSANMEAGRGKHMVVIESLNGLETVKVSGAGRFMTDRWFAAADRHSEISAKTRHMGQSALTLATSTQQAAQVGVVALGVLLIKDGSLSMGALIACVILTGRAMAPLGNLASVLSRLNRALVAYRMLGSLMEDEDDVTGREFVRRSRLDGRIEFRDVSFRYPGQEGRAVDRLSFVIEPGEKIAVLGRVGSGKSTLIRLVLGIYTPDEGNVLLDGADVRQNHPGDLSRNAGVLLQDVQLFSGTLKENILLGREGLGDEELLNAASLSGVSDFAGLSALGYNRVLQEAGSGLSVGQKQSLALARALVTDPPILLMDEPTSALDTNSERQLVARLKEATREKTCLIITHRTALLDLVDKILVLDRGRAVAFGPKDRVLSQLSGRPGAVA